MTLLLYYLGAGGQLLLQKFSFQMLLKVLYPLFPTKESICHRGQFVKLQVKDKINAKLTKVFGKD